MSHDPVVRIRHQPRGAEVFDILILALCIEHSIDEIWTLDHRFPVDERVAVVNPLISRRT